MRLASWSALRARVVLERLLLGSQAERAIVRLDHQLEETAEAL